MDNQIWNGAVAADRANRYYLALQSRNAKTQRRTETAVFALTAAVGVSLAAIPFTDLDKMTLVVTLLSTLVGGIIAWQARQRFAVKAAIADVLATQYMLLLDDWKRLWYSEKPDPTTVAVLQTRHTCLGSYLSDSLDDELNREAGKKAREILSAEFKTS